MKSLAIYPTELCCATYNTLFSLLRVKKQLMLFLAFLFFSLLSISAQCPDHTTNVCDGQRTTVDVDTLPFCDEGGDNIDGDIFQQLDCEDTNGFNCYEFKFTRQPGSTTEFFTFDVGQGQGCTGELDASYFVYDGFACTQLSNGGSQTNITFEFPDTTDALFLYLCINSNAQVTMCNVCRERPPCVVDVTCNDQFQDFIGNYCPDSDVCTDAIPAPTTIVSDVFVQSEVCDFDVIMESSDSGETNCVDANDNGQIDIVRTYTLSYIDLTAGEILVETCTQNITLLSENCCVPSAICNIQSIDETGCTVPLAFTNPNDVFSGIEACGAEVTMDHEDIGDTDICSGNGASFIRSYTLYLDGQEFIGCDQAIIINKPALEVSCPVDADVSLPACSTADEIAAAYATWSSGFGVSGGCNTTSNLGQLPTLPTYVCGGGVNLSFSLSAEDDCGDDGCSGTFVVAAADPLDVSCPADADVSLPACSTAEEIAAAYATWSSGFGVTGGCNTTSNLGQLPTLPTYVCGGGVNLSFSLSAEDDCGDDGCSGTFVVAAADPLEVSCPADADVSLPACSTADEIAAAYATWSSGFGVTGGCNTTSNLGQLPTLPTYVCGGGVNLSFSLSAEDDCGDDGCSGTFVVAAADPLEVSCPAPEVLDPSASEAEIIAAYNTWKAGFTKSGGCNPTDNLADLAVLPDFVCGNAVDISFEYIATDRCNPDGVKCSSTFKVPGVVSLDVDCPDSVDLPACTTLDEILSEYEAWVAGFKVNDGDNPTSNIADIPSFKPDDFVCGGAIDLSFTLTAFDECNPNGVSCSSTFKVAAADELKLIGECPGDNELDGCSTNNDIGAAFETWILGLKNNFTAEGGCNPKVEYSVDLDAIPTPTQCGRTDQIISVDVTANDDCGVPTQAVTCTFTVKAFESTLELAEVEPESYPSCQFESQEELDEFFFFGFVQKFRHTGGCDPMVVFPGGNAPDLCTGGTVELTYTVNDLCEERSETSTFEIVPSPQLEVSCPSPELLNPSSSEQEIKDAYELWKAGFTKSGGCNPTDNLADLAVLPDFVCGNAVDISFEYIATDRCNPDGVKCSSTFKVPGVVSLDVDCPDSVDLPACTTLDEILSEYEAWVAGFKVNDGDNPTSNIADIPTFKPDDFVCGGAIDLSFTLTAIDECNPNGVSCSSRFKVAAADELKLIGECPGDNELDSCSTDAEIGAAFAAWIQGLKDNFRAEGGCNPKVKYSTDLDQLQVPTQCGSRDQIISINVDAIDDCDITQRAICNFTVKAFESTLELNDVAPETYDSCDFETQEELNAAFSAFIGKFGYTGGCDPIVPQVVYPQIDLCEGGTIDVTYTVIDLCESKEEKASFTVNPSAPLEVSCPDPVSLGSNLTFFQILDAYFDWKDGFTKSGGCEPTDNEPDFPSLPNAECDKDISLSFEFVAKDRCNPDGVRCSSTFFVKGNESVNAGTIGKITVCEGGTVTADELFAALQGDPDANGTWDPAPAGAGTYTYTVEGEGPCPDATGTVIVNELKVSIAAEAPVCDEEFGTYSVVVNVSEDVVDVTTDNDEAQVGDIVGGEVSITNIPVDVDIAVTAIGYDSFQNECTNSVNIESPDCICIELDFDKLDITCFGEDDGKIIVNSVTEGATVTVNGLPQDNDTMYPSGDYIVRAFFKDNDDPRCVIEQLVTITEPGEVDVDVTHTDVTCFGENDGTITVTGVDDYEYYTIQKNGYGPDLSGQDFFEPGIYLVNAYPRDVEPMNFDLDGYNARAEDPCLDSTIVRILEPEELVCEISTGLKRDYGICGPAKENLLTASATGGSGGYTYFWELDNNFGSWSITSDPTAPKVYFDADGGQCVFFLTVTDSNGCETKCEYTIQTNCKGRGITNYVSTRRVDNSVKLYPNPVKDKLTLDFKELSEKNVRVQVMNLVGAVAYDKVHEGVDGKTISVDFSRFKSNVYYVKIITDSGTTIKKVILDK